MGTITLNIDAEEIPTPADGKISSEQLKDERCDSKWDVTALTTTTAWIEWDIIGIGVTVAKAGGGTVNGETLNNESVDYLIDMVAFRSPSGTNYDYSRVTMRLRASEFGAILDTRIFQRYHTGIQC